MWLGGVMPCIMAVSLVPAPSVLADTPLAMTTKPITAVQPGSWPGCCSYCIRQPDQ